ncbi:hypothetical protein V6N11_017680 [Hibiscus sabdariffa]|uniref:Uncharacterized protein n=1 Tax=Hibiscus sabdariffa TaxID=183260 RepID=A0ABR2TYQ8_9ROSI
MGRTRAATSVKLGIGGEELGNCFGERENGARDGEKVGMDSRQLGPSAAEDWGFMDGLINGLEAKSKVDMERSTWVSPIQGFIHSVPIESLSYR